MRSFNKIISRLALSVLAGTGICLATCQAQDSGPALLGVSSDSASTRGQGNPAGVAGVAGKDFKLSYSLKAQTRSWKADADVLAGAEFLMGSTIKGGVRHLSLKKVLTHPWRFWWFKAIALSGRVEGSAEVGLLDLGDGRRDTLWKLVEAEEKKADSFLRQKYQAAGQKMAYGGTCYFYVLGKEQDRFQLDTDLGNGALRSVVNDLTKTWVPDGYPRFLNGQATTGYGRWEKDAKPPFWETGSSRALALAAQLLDTSPWRDASPLATMQIGKGASYSVSCRGIPQKTRVVFESLVDKAKGQFSGTGDCTVKLDVADLTTERVVVKGHSGFCKIAGADNATYDLTLESTYDIPGKAVVASTAKVTLKKSKDDWIELSVGYEPMSGK